LSFRFLLAFCFLFVFKVNAQISVKVVDSEGKQVPFAVISLINAKDSSLIKVSLTDTLGFARFAETQSGDQLLQTQLIGFITNYSAITSDTVIINLASSAVKLKEFSIEATRSLVEVQADKVVLNVAGTMNASSNDAFELLRKAPGVVIDNNDNIIVQGKQGIRFYVDGRQLPISGADLVAYLKSIPAAQIDAIEIITQPSARFDAAGNAGIINIKLKKDLSLGLNGNYAAGGNFGVYPKWNQSISGNYRNKRVSIFGTYNWNRGRFISNNHFYREQSDSIFDQRNINRSTNGTHTAKAGADWYVNQKNTIGILYNLSINDELNNVESLTPIKQRDAIVPLKYLSAKNISENHRQNQNFNLNWAWKDTLNRSATTDFDYGFFDNVSYNYLPNTYFSSNQETVLSENNYRMKTPLRIDIASIKTDFSLPFFKGTINTGYKVSHVVTKNRFDFYNVINGVDTLNLLRSNQFDLTETIAAIYAQYIRKFKKWDLQFGLRNEYTQTIGKLTSVFPQEDGNVRRKYNNLFPTVGISFKINQKNSLGLSAGRRIDRPSYADLNPFESQLDELSYFKGNAFLQPQYSTNVQLTHTYAYMLNTSIGYNYTNNFFTEVTDTTQSNKSFLITKNVGTRNLLSINSSLPFQLTKKWSGFVTVGALQAKNKGSFGEGRDFELQRFSWNFYAQQSYLVTKHLSVEVSGFYNSPDIWGATFKNREMWGMDAGLKLQILKDKGSLNISVSDVFRSMRWRGISNFSGLYMDASGTWESHQLRFNFTYRFGNEQVKGTRNRKTGAEDEMNRVK
jgi:iron complex outermembrane recepter protein